MQKYPFIFSDEWKYRIARHASFWLFWVLFQALLYSTAPIDVYNQATYFNKLMLSLLDSSIYIIVHMFLSYSLMYIVIPGLLLKQRYWLTALCTFLLFLLTAILSALLTKYVIGPMRDFFSNDSYKTSPIRIYNADFYKSVLAGLRGGITIGGIAATIKLMKYWYIKEQRNLQLQKENAESQLQLLKAQVHPHFLFNTLNNIYAYTQNTSPVAAKMVTGLSDMLRFILYEANQSFVPLSKELRMVQDYISLEQIRYGNKLEIHISLPEQTNGLCIAPLLLLPLVENCFKHGASNILDHPWINLHIILNKNEMHMKLINGKAVAEEATTKGHGIGISNVEKRLSLLYPGKYEFTVTNDPDVFIVNLKVELEQRRTEEPKLTVQSKSFHPVYV